MTAYHDAVMALEPAIFVPFDASGDTSTTAQDLMGLGTMVASGSTKEPVMGEVAFTNELQCDGSEYWVADSTLETRIIAALTNATDFTIGVWWRTSQPTSDATARVMLGLTDDGVRMYRQFGSVIITFYNASAVAQNETAIDTSDAETGAGWQLSGMQLDSEEDFFAALRGYSRVSGLAVADGSTVRTTSSNAFYYGATASGASTWVGSLGPFAVWDRVLTPHEWADFYHAGLGAVANNPSTYPILSRPFAQRMGIGKTYMREEDDD